VIQSFADRETQRLFELGENKKDGSAARKALFKLIQLDEADSLKDMKAPPGNHLEALKGTRIGEYSIRINDQFRICFTWKEDGPHNVGIIDYH